jgi:hypothetical protein
MTHTVPTQRPLLTPMRLAVAIAFVAVASSFYMVIRMPLALATPIASATAVTVAHADTARDFRLAELGLGEARQPVA